ncbi:hypothetical protein HDU76_010819, partial [Blyttiomyces sp. JEL0837]
MKVFSSALVVVAGAVLASAYPGGKAQPRSTNIENCPPGFNHVITIVLENEDNANVMKDPYMGTNLTSRGYYLSNMNGVWHPSQPNYIAMISGSIHFPLVLTDND